MEELVAVQPVAIPIETATDEVIPTPAAPEPPNRCCCSILHITTASYIISVTFAILIVINFVVKIAGYTDLEWNWELLFLCSDSIAVACLLYGTYIESAAFFQPFVILSIITISFLLLLLAYVGAAVYDPHSYPGEYLELLLHEHLNSASQRFHMELKNVVSLSASIAAVVIVIALGCHICFVIVALRCARYFRMRPQPKKPSLPTTTVEAAVSERAKRPVKLVPEPLFDWLPMNPDIYAEPPAVWRGV
uniref:MARVEL domain-containing protein n=1 Tax=Panagrellus redivivus TaxID=6233 RepID=A0A7E4W7A9_PANRE